MIRNCIETGQPSPFLTALDTNFDLEIRLAIGDIAVTDIRFVVILGFYSRQQRHFLRHIGRINACLQRPWLNLLAVQPASSLICLMGDAVSVMLFCIITGPYQSSSDGLILIVISVVCRVIKIVHKIIAYKIMAQFNRIGGTFTWRHLTSDNTSI